MDLLREAPREGRRADVVHARVARFGAVAVVAGRADGEAPAVRAQRDRGARLVARRLAIDVAAELTVPVLSWGHYTRSNDSPARQTVAGNRSETAVQFRTDETQESWQSQKPARRNPQHKEKLREAKP